jgi:hypothetical protein
VQARLLDALQLRAALDWAPPAAEHARLSRQAEAVVAL